jgi:uncharacterized protein (DUF1684 family)
MVNPMKSLHAIALPFFLATALALAGCRGHSPPPVDAVAQAGDAALAAFRAEHARWVEEHARDLSRPDGWTSLIGLHWVEEGSHVVGGGEDSTIRLAIAPPRLGRVERRGEQLLFTAAPGTDLRVNGEPPPPREVDLQPEGREAGTVLTYDGGKGRITAIGRGGQFALRVRHAEAPTRQSFRGLDFFPADPGWRVRARFVAHPPGRTLPIVNLIGNVNENPNPGYVEFEKEGRLWRLEALGDPRRDLNLMFQDGTSGKESYAVGRYLHTGPVAADGTVEIDFNRAYNPPCAYTPYATCPLPPPENRLAQRDGERLVRLAVRAGERKYPLARH